MKKAISKRISLSIGTKVDFTLIILFSSMLIISAVYLFYTQRSMVDDTVKHEAMSIADSYFDNINTLMLTGGIANREISRKKVLASESILDARIIRGEGVKKIFGPGLDYAKVMDDFDARGLAGEEIKSFKETPDGRVLTVVVPVKALEDFRGTNCRTCHVVPEGEVLGAVRIDYSLAAFDARVLRDLWINIAINAGLFLIGLITISLILKKIVIKPIKYITRTVESIERESNLGHRIDLACNDELGDLGITINNMMEKFDHIIKQVLNSTNQLLQESQNLAKITLQSSDGIKRQQDETDMVATAMTEMEQTSNEVANNARQGLETTQSTDIKVNEGRTVVQKVRDSINNLATDINSAAEVVGQLEADSVNIGNVVEVIRNIAEQTNLLALNAAIEAARAGEQGRGFAVVADEVRTLANRTHESTQEIQNMVESLQAQARNAANAMTTSQQYASETVHEAHKADETLSEVTEAVGQITLMNTQINSAVNEQSAVAAEMTQNITAINQVSEQSVIRAEQTNNASQALSALAENLHQLVKVFR